MKFKDIKILSWILMGLTLAVTSCRDDTFREYFDDANSDEFTVTINVGLEGMEASTRADETWEEHIGNGSKIDMLVYAVYYDKATDKDDPNHIPVWEAATEYVKVDDPEEAIKNAFPDEDVKISLGHGQSILKVSGTLDKGKKQPITLTLKKGQSYRVVFWAQNHATEAFVIDDLKRVQMKYKVLHETPDDKGQNIDDIRSINNDEARDAFCRSIALSGDQSNRNITIYLKRPLAQINVGTRGFDFESITRNAAQEDKFLYSKIRINRAARYLNVVTDEIYTSTIDSDEEETEAFYTIDYEYNKIPAYWKMEIPKYPSYTIYDLENNTEAYKTFITLHHEDLTGEGDDDKTKYRNLYEQEEFLKVKLYSEAQLEQTKFKKGEDGYVTYSSMGNSMEEGDDLDRSEIFKYLSMCYVLTNSSDEYQDVLTNVKVWLANEDKTKEVEVVNLTQVPVQRNRRTNIVGSLLTAKAEMQIIVDDDFAGRKISDDGDASIQSGEITEGFYYDADKDEFQISSINGLLFFQQLVNGDLTVRQYTNNVDGVTLGSPYPYTKEDDNTIYRLKYKSWKYEDLGDEKANILIKALKLNSYDKVANSENKFFTVYEGSKYKGKDGKKNINVLLRKDTKWPLYNNFSFFGATVKLMADIDLSGIEWIPIGFDCINWDSSIGPNQAYSTDKITQGFSGGQVNATNYRTISSSNGEGSVNFDHRRIFAGTFDGNGHTIYNMSTKEFGAEVLGYNQQTKMNDDSSSSDGPYDNIPWFGRGFFGVCGPGVEIKNLRLQNVNVTGNNGVAALVAFVNSPEFEANIDNCSVDGGTITAVPLYRYEPSGEKDFHGRTHARGVYVAGIVGQFCALGENAGVTNCEVRNVEISGFRRVGGIIGSIADQGSDKMGNSFMQLDIKVEQNYVRNSQIICNQYVPFDYMRNEISDGVWKNGLGWGASSGTSPMSDIIVGGNLDTVDAFELTYESRKNKGVFYDSYIPDNNGFSNVSYTVLATRPNENGESTLTNAPINTVRESEIGNVSLEVLPSFTSLYVDEVNLTNNYYGAAKLFTKINFNDKAQVWRGEKTKDNRFIFPLVFPNGAHINYDKNRGGLAGMYVESVYITGENNVPSKRSVITPTGVGEPNSCVMYITARNREQFKNKPINVLSNLPEDTDITKSTIVKNMVLRGSPYAWAGIILAPNENMREVILNNVTIYDVYKTLTLESLAPSGTEEYNKIQNYTVWPNTKYDIKLNLEDCNLRGYTIPGAGWTQINYTKTTFEAGSETKYSSSSGNLKDENGNLRKDGEGKPVLDDYLTCKVEAPTDFTNCFFKAPFFIDLSDAQNGKVNFNNCYGASAYDNVKIELKDGVHYICIDKNIEKGRTVVTYYDENGIKI